MGQSNIKSSWRHQGETNRLGAGIHTDKAGQLKSRLASGRFEAGPEIAAVGQKLRWQRRRAVTGLQKVGEEKESATLPEAGPAILSQRHQQMVKDNF